MAEIKTEVKNEWSIYKLVYKKGNILHELYFKSLDQNMAHTKAKEYCEKRALRMINVSEWLKDIQQMIDFEVDDNWKGRKME